MNDHLIPKLIEAVAKQESVLDKLKDLEGWLHPTRGKEKDLAYYLFEEVDMYQKQIKSYLDRLQDE